MPSFRLSNPFRRGVDRLSLKQRAASLKATAAKALRRTSADADQDRRSMIAGSLAAAVPLPAVASPATAITGAILGTAPYKTGRDLSAVAEAWIDDARDLGMHVLIGPDGNMWRAMPVGDGERYEARDAHWFKLNNRPPLLRAVHAAVKRRGVNHG